MKTLRISNLVAAIGLVTASIGGMAATDGSLGATSTGSTIVTMSVADRVQISGLEDIALGGWSGAGDLVGASAFCVYRNGTGLYDVTVSSANELAGVFRASNGTKFVEYGVNYDIDADASDGSAIVSSVTESGLAGHALSPSCAASDNASIQVTFAAAELSSAQSGFYADTLTLLVEPN